MAQQADYANMYVQILQILLVKCHLLTRGSERCEHV
jgi:hypothetical protein